MRHSNNRNIIGSMFRNNPYPALDSLSTSQNLENNRFECQPDKNKSYRPIVALNIDIGEDVPVKIFIYDFTDPWKRAYEFL